MAFGDTIQSAQASAASNNVTPTLGTGATAGNLLIAGFSSSVDCSWGTISGWTQLTIIDATSNVDAVWYYKIAAGGETSVTSNKSGSGNTRGIIVEFEGPFDATPLDQTAEDESNRSTVVTSQASGTTGTTTSASELALAFFTADSASNVDGSRTYNNSFSEVIFASTTDSIARTGIALAKRILTVTGTYSCTFSVTDTGDEMYGAIATFKAQSSNTAPTVTPDTADAATFNDSTPTLLFTGTDADADDITYQIQISDNPDFASGTNIVDSYTDQTNIGTFHPNPMGSLTWEGNQQVDERFGQSFTGKGGVLDKISVYFGRDETGVDGTAYVRVYAHQGTFGTSSEPLNAADAADTPTSNWLAISNGIAVDDTYPLNESAWYDFTFSGANRIKLTEGQKYVLVVDWVPNGTSEPSTNTIELIGSTNLGHAGNMYIDGGGVNNGIWDSADLNFRVYEVQTVLDKTSGTDAGFVNEDNGADTSPFTSGDQISYTVQAGDTLADGVYYWRVRGNDGTDTGNWTATRSFTVDTTSGVNIYPSGITSGNAFGTASVQPQAVSVSPTAIGSTEAFGTLNVNQNVIPNGIDTVEALGSPTINVGAPTITPTGIASAEAFGTTALQPGAVSVSPNAIGTGEAFGSATVQPGAVIVTPSSITSSEVFGTAQLNLSVQLIGIATAEAFGTPTVAPQAVSVSPAGIASGEALGTVTISQGAITLNPSSIASGEVFGTTTIQRGAVAVVPTGIASNEAFGTAQLNLNIGPAGITGDEAFGTAVIERGAVAISLSSITSAEAFGSPTVSQGGGLQNVSPSGIVSAEAFGTAQLNLNITPSGIASAEVFGTHTITPGSVSVSPTGIPSAEAFGAHIINTGFTVYPSSIASAEVFGVPSLSLGIWLTSIPSAESFGNSQLNLNIASQSIASVEAFGTPIVSSGGIFVVPSSIPSTEAFGAPTLTTGAVTVAPSGIGSAETFGNIQLSLSIVPGAISTGEIFGTLVITVGAITVNPSSIISTEAFGAPVITTGAVSVEPAGIVSVGAVGTPTVELAAYSIRPVGIGSAETFGTLTVLPGAVTITAAGIVGGETFGTLLIANAIELQPLRLDVYITEALYKSVYISQGLVADVYMAEGVAADVYIR